MRMFDYLLFSDKRLGRLTSREVEYWQMMFRKVLKVGEEFEVIVPNNRNLDSVREDIEVSLRPSSSIHHHGNFGIKEVTFDGSVPHGLEIITVGKRFDWKTFYDMNSLIMDEFKQHDIYTSTHTGMHIHLLAGYTNNDITELEKPVPEIILANFYQLHRIFAPELYWIASGGDKEWAITRYNLFRRPPLEYSAVTTSMGIIREEMHEKYGKYQMINMNPCRIRGREVSTFHVEIRHPDTHLSPAYANALVALEVALLYKAIDLSQCGIISIKQDEYDFKKEILDRFVNLGTGDRESDSTELTGEDIESLQYRSSAMIRWLKSEILNINPIAYDVLKQISIKPSALMRIEGMSWSEIEKTIYTPKMVDRSKLDKMLEMIVLQQITDCITGDEWLNQASNRLNVPIDKTKELMNDIGLERVVSFDDELGCYIFKQIV